MNFCNYWLLENNVHRKEKLLRWKIKYSSSGSCFGSVSSFVFRELSHHTRILIDKQVKWKKKTKSDGRKRATSIGDVLRVHHGYWWMNELFLSMPLDSLTLSTLIPRKMSMIYMTYKLKSINGRRMRVSVKILLSKVSNCSSVESRLLHEPRYLHTFWAPLVCNNQGSTVHPAKSYLAFWI